VKKRWDEIKAEEKKAKGEVPKLLLEGVPRAVLPGEAAQISSRAARAGFDWENVDQVFREAR
jgi:uncharacterized protein YabN with tetrapyrrole methylase and pyrophosphatase domain